MKRGDDYIFTEEDTRSDDNLPPNDNILKDAVVRAFIENKITFKDFTERHRRYMIDSGRPLSKIASSRNNLLKALLYKKKISYSMFETIFKNILKLNLSSFSITVRDDNNKIITFSADRITY